MNEPNYLRRLARHKRAIAGSRIFGAILGWAFAYLLLAGIVVGLGEVGFYLLTGRAFSGLGQILGFLILVALPALAAELFRPRRPK